MSRTIKRYSELYKQKVIQDLSSGKFDSIAGAARAYGIDKYETVVRWLRQEGRVDLLPADCGGTITETVKEKRQEILTPAFYYPSLSN